MSLQLQDKFFTNVKGKPSVAARSGAPSMMLLSDCVLPRERITNSWMKLSSAAIENRNLKFPLSADGIKESHVACNNRALFPQSVLGTSDEFFQNGVKLYMECYEHQDPSRKREGLEQASRMFLEVIRLEQEKVRRCSPSGTLESEKLIVALSALATAYATLGRSQECFRTIDEIRFWKSCKLPFAVENRASQAASPLGFQNTIGEQLPLQTTGEPILSKQKINKLRKAAQEYRASLRENHSVEGDLAVQVSDLVANDPSILNKDIDPLLQDKIYPLVRESFLVTSDLEELPLCVTDVMIVRTEENEERKSENAPLPWHKDKGLFTVNIVLSSADEGSGAVPGRAVAYRSTAEDQPGSDVLDGIQECLVMHLTLRPHRQPLGLIRGLFSNAPAHKKLEGVERALYLEDLAQTQEWLPMTQETQDWCHKWATELKTF